MNDEVYFEEFIRAYATKGLLIDTNVLLLYLIGQHDPAYIPVYKRTQKYTPDDYSILCRFVRPFQRLIMTPQILAEVHNLSQSVQKSRVRKYFATLVHLLRPATEYYVEKNVLLENSKLPQFGFTDLSILETARTQKVGVLTDDLAAAGMLQKARCGVVNFNHLRQYCWFG